jgi:flagellar motility protein MotE (MotC chaperone)
LFEKYEIRRIEVSKKKLIIITAGAGLISFAGAFVFALFTVPSPAIPDKTEQSASASDGSKTDLQAPEDDLEDVLGTTPEKMKTVMTEQQLKNLIQDIRAKMQEYDTKLQDLGVREQRLQIAQDVLKKDIESLNNMRIELTSVISNIRSEQDKLLKSRLEISQTEQTNLMSIAATYDKMEPASASKILANMCDPENTGQVPSEEVIMSSESFNDAVKILHYMTERTEAKLLAEIAASRPELAATLCQRLKQIVEVQ